MRVLVVEDEAIVARRLMRMVGNILGDRVELIRHVSTLDDARQWLNEHVVDLLFLDLNLNGRDGFEILADMVARSFHTVIVSAHADQALRAFEYGVADFVAKPYDETRLRKAIERVTSGDASAREQLRFLAVRKVSEVQLVPQRDIEFIRGAGDYSEIHTSDDTTHLHDKTLSALERILPARFHRIHRSYIVDTERIESMHSAPGSRYFVQLHSGRRLPIGRSRLESLRQFLTGTDETSN